MVDHVHGTEALAPVLVGPPTSRSSCLLDISSLDARLTAETDFVEGCEDGYKRYFDPDVIEPETMMTFHGPQMLKLTLNDLMRCLLVLLLAKLARPYMIGWCVGWLSALAVAHPTEAARGMQVLASLVATLYACEVQ